MFKATITSFLLLAVSNASFAYEAIIKIDNDTEIPLHVLAGVSPNKPMSFDGIVAAKNREVIRVDTKAYTYVKVTRMNNRVIVDDHSVCVRSSYRISQTTNGQFRILYNCT